MSEDVPKLAISAKCVILGLANGKIAKTIKYIQMADSFLAETTKILIEKDLSKYQSLREMADKWESWVQFIIKNGYGDYLDEYYNDFWIRKDIVKVLSAPELEAFEEFQEFKKNIGESDDKLRALFLPDVEIPLDGDWWEKGVLKNGWGYYVSDLHEYGIQIPGGKPWP